MSDAFFMVHDKANVARATALMQAQARLGDTVWGGPCGCVGPQNGEPLCPCQMRSVSIKNGRYVRVQDFGPAPTGATP